MSKLSARLALLVLVAVLLSTLALDVPRASGWAEPELVGLLWLNPQNASAPVGTTTSLTLELDNITNVYGAQVELGFDPAFLEVVGSQVTPGTCPQPDFVAANTADNLAGTIEYGVAQLNPTPPCDGGLVATIELRCKAETSPSTVVSIVSSLISDPDGMPLEHTTQDATVECVSGFAVEGTVGLQSWPGGPEGISVILQDSGGSTVDQQVVGPDGAFSLTAVDVTETYSVTASYPRYLSVEAGGITGSAGGTVDLGRAILPAGDVNGDGQINIQDIAILGGNYDKRSPVAWPPLP